MELKSCLKNWCPNSYRLLEKNLKGCRIRLPFLCNRLMFLSLHLLTIWSYSPKQQPRTPQCILQRKDNFHIMCFEWHLMAAQSSDWNLTLIWCPPQGKHLWRAHPFTSAQIIALTRNNCSSPLELVQELILDVERERGLKSAWDPDWLH